MARVPFIEVDDHPELNELATQIRAKRNGKVSHLYAMLLHSPPLASCWLELLTTARAGTILAGSDRELVILLIAVINDAPHEFKTHAPLALKQGVTQAHIDALANWRASSVFDARQRAVLAYAEAMTRDVKVADPVFSAVREILNDRELVELTALTATYNMVSRFLAALQI